MTVNLELLNATLEMIKANPDKYDQNSWVKTDEYSPCGTTMCFAGQAAVLAGAEIPDPKKHNIVDWFVSKDEKKSYLNIDDVYYGNNEVPSEHVQDFATRELNLSFEEREYLFECDRTIEEIERAVRELNETGRIQTMWHDDEDDYDYDDYCDCEECC